MQSATRCSIRVAKMSSWCLDIMIWAACTALMYWCVCLCSSICVCVSLCFIASVGCSARNSLAVSQYANGRMTAPFWQSDDPEHRPPNFYHLWHLWQQLLTLLYTIIVFIYVLNLAIYHIRTIFIFASLLIKSPALTGSIYFLLRKANGKPFRTLMLVPWAEKNPIFYLLKKYFHMTGINLPRSPKKISGRAHLKTTSGNGIWEIHHKLFNWNISKLWSHKRLEVGLTEEKSLPALHK